MKVRISDLPAAGLPLAFELKPTLLNERLQEGHPCELLALSPVTVNGQLRPLVDEGAELCGRAQVRVTQPCARCTEAKERELTVELRMFLKPRPEQTHPGESFDDDVGLSFYRGEYVDLQEIVIEACILQIDLFWKPELDKKGNCSLCRNNFAQTEIQPPTGQNPFRQIK